MIQVLLSSSRDAEQRQGVVAQAPHPSLIPSRGVVDPVQGAIRVGLEMAIWLAAVVVGEAHPLQHKMQGCEDDGQPAHHVSHIVQHLDPAPVQAVRADELRCIWAGFMFVGSWQRSSLWFGPSSPARGSRQVRMMGRRQTMHLTLSSIWILQPSRLRTCSILIQADSIAHR